MERALFIESLTLREQQLEVHRASLAAQLRGPEPATEPQTLNCLRILSEMCMRTGAGKGMVWPSIRPRARVAAIATPARSCAARDSGAVMCMHISAPLHLTQSLNPKLCRRNYE